MTAKRSVQKGRFDFQSNLRELVLNAMTSRVSWLKRLLDPRRDIGAECGHPTDVTVGDYADMFGRSDVARRVVSIFPEETWSDDPEVYETEDPNKTDFEEAWDSIMKRFPLYSYLQRADTLSGVGQFGIILIGIDDKKKTDEAVEGISEEGEVVGTPSNYELLYLRPLDQTCVQINKLVDDNSNPRYGQPESYNIQLADTSLQLQPTMGRVSGVTESNLKVHWTRVIHVADNRTNSEVYGVPRMQPVFNRLLDLRKVSGGSAEMFWKGGFPGLALEVDPEIAASAKIDKQATRDEMEDYMNGLKRYIALVGMKAKNLDVNIADPKPQVEVQLRLIAMALGVPWRIFVGSEAAHLASSQDILSWHKRVKRRRLDYVNPFLIRALVDRFIAFGVLPEPVDGYQIHWPDMDSQTDEEKAKVAQLKSDALSKYVLSGAWELMPPLQYLTMVLGMSLDEAQMVVKQAGDMQLGANGNDDDGDNHNGSPNRTTTRVRRQAPTNQQ